MALDPEGNLWVADTGNHVIRRIDAAGTVETIAGRAGGPGLADGSGDQARFHAPVGITLEPEPLAELLERELRGDPPPPIRMIVADRDNGVLRRVTEDGEVKTIGAVEPQGRGRVGLGVAPLTFEQPTGVAVDPSGTIYVAETGAGAGEGGSARAGGG